MSKSIISDYKIANYWKKSLTNTFDVWRLHPILSIIGSMLNGKIMCDYTTMKRLENEF